MTSTASTSPPLLNRASLFAALAGAGGGFASFPVGEVMNALMGGDQVGDLLHVILLTSFWSGAIGLIIGAAILVYDNAQSLRGAWHRDLLFGLPIFFGLSFVGGATAQISYSFVQNSLTRGLGWALAGASIGMGIGLLRRDMVQALRGMLGGIIGGFLGGFIFDWLSMHSVGGDAFSRLIGQILMGALIALLMRVVQDALKSAWLLGISTGPFEGKEYPLNTARVSVGRAETNDISLFREESTQPHMGALTFHDGQWWWQGEAIGINGVAQSNAVLSPGDTLQIGATRFRFQTRSVKSSAGIPAVSPAYTAPSYTAPSPTGDAYAYAPPPTATTPQSFALMTPDGQVLTWPAALTSVAVGRASQNDLVLSEPTVSSHHAILQVAGDRFFVSDQSSTYGTFVNGNRVTPGSTQPLAVGDRIRFGNLEAVVSVV